MTGREFPIGGSITIEELATNPHPVLAKLRKRESVSWIPVFNGWMVTRPDLCIAVMRDAERFTVDDPRFSTGQRIGPSMLSLDGIEHKRHREPFVDPFRSAEVRVRFSDWARSRAQQLVSEIAPLGSSDLRTSIAAPLSVEVTNHALDLIGVGPHACLGIHLARLEARAAVDAALDQLSGLELDSDRIEEAQGLIFRAPATVQARWDVR